MFSIGQYGNHAPSLILQSTPTWLLHPLYKNTHESAIKTWHEGREEEKKKSKREHKKKIEKGVSILVG
jgi:hypothetical protein